LDLHMSRSCFWICFYFSILFLILHSPYLSFFLLWIKS
jgi:hypothetical protein